MYDYVQFDSFSQAKAAMSLSKVRFLCNQCGKIHYASCVPNTSAQKHNDWGLFMRCIHNLQDSNKFFSELFYYPDLIICLALKPKVLENGVVIKEVNFIDSFGDKYAYRAYAKEGGS